MRVQLVDTDFSGMSFSIPMVKEQREPTIYEHVLTSPRGQLLVGA